MSNALSYVRWSTDDQSKGDSEARQTRLAQQVCAARGWHLSETVIESGRSAYHGINRAAGGKLAAIEKRAVAGELNGWVLIVENLDRLSRQRPQESLELLTKLTDAGVMLCESGTGIAYTAESLKDNWQNLLVPFIRAGLAFEESDKKSSRIKSAWAETKLRGATKDGKADGRLAPRWIEVIDGEYSIVPTRAKAVVSMYERCAEGMGLRAIAKDLNRTTPRWTKGEWTAESVGQIIKSRNALGEYCSTEKLPDGKRTPTGEWRELFPAIVDVELWHRANDALASRRTTGGKRVEFANVLTGFSYCAHHNPHGYCGARMSMSMKPTASGQRRMLRCSSRHRGGKCGNSSVFYYDRILQGILDNVLRFTLPLDKPTSDQQASLAVMQTELKQASERLDRLVDSFSKTGSEAMQRGIVRLEQIIKEQKVEIERVRRLVESETHKRDRTDIAAEVQSLIALVPTSADARRRVNALLREVIDGVMFYREPNEVHVLVAGVHAFRFNKEGELLQEAVATSALLDGAHVDRPLARERYGKRAA